MRVIGAGLPRTGTLSQKVALEMVGLGPCYHMVNVLANLDLAPQWRRAMDGDGQWDEIFDGFQSTVDWPGSFFYRELIEVYPDAKVVLGVRDGDSWARSMRETIWGLFYDDVLIRHLSSARATIDRKWHDYIEMMKEMWQRSGLIDGEDTTAERMSSALERYHDEVQGTVPSERLLVWSVTEGWEPLCEFLEVPVPDTPFPKLNDSTEFAERIVDASLASIQEWRAQQQQEPVDAADG
jgi:Sulfotransferase domain